MLRTIVNNVVIPLLTRIGTIAGTSLLALGADETLVNQVIVGIMAIGLIGLDLVLDKLFPRTE